jgi:iron complex transport system substrate-binding protein
MIFLRAFFFILLLVSTVTPAVAADIAVVDDRGKSLELSHPAQRIVALAPSITELIFAAGAGHALVGVVRFSDYPPQAKTIVSVGDASRVDLERIVALQPDLIIAWKSGNQAADIERLEQLGLKVYVVEPERLTDIPRLLRTIGLLAGSVMEANEVAEGFERTAAELRQRYAAQTPLRVFYEIWHAPLMTVNGQHMISDVIQLCGGVNVFAGLPVLTPVVSLESVIAAGPQAVVGGGSATDAAEFTAQWQQAAQPYVALAGLHAIYIAPDLIQRQTPRMLDGAREMCEQLENIRSNHR